MSSKSDSLGDRMKRYESVSKTRLIRRIPVIIRLDGKAFHTFTKGFVRPFDSVLMQTMDDTMKYLCENIQGCVLGYKQSDEISLVLVDYRTLTTEPWLDYQVEKMCSIAASMATLAFNTAWKQNVEAWQSEISSDWDCSDLIDQDNLNQAKIYISRFNSALFDARVFNVPKEEVNNCILWRQQDATRNSIQLAGQAQFSYKQLQNKFCDQIQDMLFLDKGINWNDYPVACKRGTCCIKRSVDVPGATTRSVMVQRKKWVIDKESPIFSKKPEYINQLIYV